MANELKLIDNGGASLAPSTPHEQPPSWLPSRPASLSEAMAIAKIVADSDLAPKDYRGKPANVLVAFQLGAELGLAPMQAIQNIAVINGRPSVWGDAMLAIVQGSGKLEWIKETDDGETATCTVKRRGWPEETTRTFSRKDAQQANLSHKDIWKLYDRRMRQMRARSFCLRDVFADVLRGVSMAEESMDIETTATPVPAPPPTMPEAARPHHQTTTEKLKAKLEKQVEKQVEKQEGEADLSAVIGDVELKHLILLQKECAVSDEEFKAYLEKMFGIKTRKAIMQRWLPSVQDWLWEAGFARWRTQVDGALAKKQMTEEDYLLYVLKEWKIEQESALTVDQRAAVLQAIESGAVSAWRAHYREEDALEGEE